ncbi:MAG: RnfABCDGE type electron transport complex subunit G [Succinivibrionaceae bacterium]|nr:RnfABCDGE type electron transport complex subunit G [Succinivibrionaceae bacterium]
MKPIVKGSIITGLYLATLTCISFSIITYVHEKTYETYVKAAEKDRLNKQMAQMLPDVRYDNNLIKSCKLYNSQQLTNGDDYEFYTAYRKGRPVAYIIKSVTMKGYGGAIGLLTSLNNRGEILKVVITSQHETPGLGDRVLPANSNWLEEFNGASLYNRKNFALTKDGGDFTYVTGATVTPRAIVNAEKDLLEYFSKKGNRLLSDKRCAIDDE